MLLDLMSLHAAPGQVAQPGTIAFFSPDLDGLETRADERLLAAMNFGPVHLTLEPPRELPRRATLLRSSDPDRVPDEVDLSRFVLLPCESVLLLVAED
jgi:hypothetical protein